jgi:hypothetical protein
MLTVAGEFAEGAFCVPAGDPRCDAPITPVAVLAGAPVFPTTVGTLVVTWTFCESVLVEAWYTWRVASASHSHVAQRGGSTPGTRGLVALARTSAPV